MIATEVGVPLFWTPDEVKMPVRDKNTSFHGGEEYEFQARRQWRFLLWIWYTWCFPIILLLRLSWGFWGTWITVLRFSIQYLLVCVILQSTRLACARAFLVYTFGLLIFCSYRDGNIAFIHTQWTWHKHLNTNRCLTKVHMWKGIKCYSSNIASLGNIVTISTLLSLYRWSIDGVDDVYVHEQCNDNNWDETTYSSSRIKMKYWAD